MFNSIADYPASEMGALFAAAFVAVTWAAIFLFRPIVRSWVHRGRSANDMVGFTLASFSTLYGILLGLLAVEAYQDFSTVNDTLSKEASSLATLYRDLSGYPQPIRTDLQDRLRDYTREAIEENWSEERKGVASTREGSHRLKALFEKFLSFKPKEKSEEIIHAESLRQFNAVIELRRFRIASGGGGIPPILWWVVGIGAFLHIVLICLFDMERHVHLLLGGALSLFLGAVIYLIVALDNPFRGGATIGPEPIQTVLDTVMKPD